MSNLSLVFLLILFTASCGLFNTEQGTQKSKEEQPAAQVFEKPVVKSESFALSESSKVGLESTGPTKLAIESLSPNEIRRVQTALKENKFDPGPVDGILGPKTKMAFRRLQLGCSKLEDIAKISDADVRQLKPGVESGAPSGPVKLNLSQGGVERLQANLKHAGFDPGPVDGKLGPRTKSALLAARSACSLANQFRVIESENFPAAKNPQVPTISSTPPTDTRVSDASRSSDSSDPGGNGLSITADKIAGVDEIRLVQVTLRNAGFDPGPIDGIFGPRTRSALQRYRASNGVKNIPVRASGIGSRKEY